MDRYNSACLQDLVKNLYLITIVDSTPVFVDDKVIGSIPENKVYDSIAYTNKAEAQARVDSLNSNGFKCKFELFTIREQ